MENIYIDSFKFGEEKLRKNIPLTYKELKDHLLRLGYDVFLTAPNENLFIVWFFENFTGRETEITLQYEQGQKPADKFTLWALRKEHFEDKVYLKADSYFKLLQFNEYEQIKNDSEAARKESIKSINFARNALIISIIALVITVLFSILNIGVTTLFSILELMHRYY